MDDDYVTEEVDEWQLISSLGSSSNYAQWISKNETPVIKDDFFSEFAVAAPNYHQGVTMPTSQESQIQESSTEQTIYSRLNDQDHNENIGYNGDEHDGVENEDGKKRGVRVDAWKSRLVEFVSKAKRAKWWFPGFAVTGVMSMVVVSLWCMKVGRRRKRMHMERVEKLMLLIRERDQKIDKLLLQIAQMNETLSARRTVQVIRVV